MNEVRDIVARMLDHEPEPPLRAADDVLRIARRDKRRREWLGASTVGGVVLAMVVGLISLVSPGAPTPVGGVDRLPAAQAAASHGDRLAARLLTAVPAGYTPATPTTFGHGTTVYPTAEDRRSRVLAAAVVTVAWGPNKGQLYAYLVYDGQAPPGDPCGDPGGGECWMTTVHSVPIRVVTVTDPARGYVATATRFLDGGRLTVGAAQGLPLDDPGYGPPLNDPLLDGWAVAALAADPEMLP